ncbi:hypothetical protein MAA5396_04838 [Marinovum algicola]|uniref:Type II toxin-antitoxin system PemK/MazF family toxin n=1 Tax=Marinovum algicola TaxID=42444 RepID=A0A975ZQZ3_9RHOB|nr:hypothetical protein [Marinovum algicola]SEK10298.1 hypothetical protein SAMN04487940_13234 [Marinovum algicola]SLN76887.1 hypothetical protein MAA5396_04838 [Marinovum algicola]
MSHAATDPVYPGDIVSFRFPYSEGMAPYARPCVVLDATEDELLLAYGTSSRERANVGFELRVNAEFAECGLDRASRFVLARRIRIARSDPRLETNASGTPVLGRLTEALRLRKADLFARIKASWPEEAARLEAERRGLHPRKGDRRRRAGAPYRI